MGSRIHDIGLAAGVADADRIIAAAHAMRAETLRAMARALFRPFAPQGRDAGGIRRMASAAARALAGRAGLERLNDRMLEDIGLTRHDVVGRRMLLDGHRPPLPANANQESWAA